MRLLAPLAFLFVGGCVAYAGDNTASANLAEVARAATAMVDGDICSRIETPRSLEYATKKDPRDPWRDADNYDVDDQAFTQTKKTLIRLAHLCVDPCDVNLWMRAPGPSGRVQIVIRNVHELSQFWNWGEMNSPMPVEMQRVFDHAEPVTVRRKPGMTSVLTPVFDSLGKVVAIAEVVSESHPDSRENVK